VRLAEGTKVAATAPGEQPATPAPTERRRRNRAPGQSSGGR
jgi:hypothetical protein